MIDTQWINGALDLWWSWMVPMTWQLCLLVAAIAVLTLLARKASPRVHYLLWCLVLVKLCLPPTVSFYTGLGQFLPAPGEPPLSVTKPADTRIIQEMVARAIWPQAGVEHQYGPLIVPDELPVVSHIPSAAGILWLIGMMAMVSLLLYQSIHAYMKLRHSRVADDKDLLKSFSDACEHCGIKRHVPLLVTTELKSPVILGPLRPRIILPHQTIARLSPAEMKAVLIHELCHLKRHDPWVNLLQALLLAIYWFHPLVWLTVSRLRSLREVIVDDLVLHHLDGRAEVYGSSLLNVLQGSANRPLVAPGYVGIAENRTGLQQRVRRVLDDKHSRSLKIGIASSALIIVTALILIPQARTQRPPVEIPELKEVREMADQSKSVAHEPTTTGKLGSRLSLLVEWTSHQQVNWDIRMELDKSRFRNVVVEGQDTGRSRWESNQSRLSEIREDGRLLSISSVTGWDTAGAVIALGAPADGCGISVTVSDPYVKDRLTRRDIELVALMEQVEQIDINSKEWPLQNSFLTLTAIPEKVEFGRKVLSCLSTDRRSCIDALMQMAEDAQTQENRLKLLFRAAAASTGGCNHGPLEPDGWDQAISIYQTITEEFHGTDAATNALWAQAMSNASWSPHQIGCDMYALGRSDWKGAYQLYERIYTTSKDPGSRADALRRMAEVQCFLGQNSHDGLQNYRRIIEEYPGQVVPSQYWTYRTCAPNRGTSNIAWDIHKAITYNTSSPQHAKSVFEYYFGELSGNPHADELKGLIAGSAAPVPQ